MEFVNCRRTWITFAWTILGDWWGLEPYGPVLIFHLPTGSLSLQEVTRKSQEEPPLPAWGFPLSPDTSPRKATSFLKDKTDSRSHPPGTRDQLMWLSPKERGAPTKSRTWCPRREDIREPEKGSLIIICQDFRVKGITMQYQRKKEEEEERKARGFKRFFLPQISCNFTLFNPRAEFCPPFYHTHCKEQVVPAKMAAERNFCKATFIMKIRELISQILFPIGLS